MKRYQDIFAQSCLILLLAGLLGTTSVLADKPPWAGGGKGKAKQEEHSQNPTKEKPQKNQPPTGNRYGSSVSAPPSTDLHFSVTQDAIVRDYYSRTFAAGSCPPGLAKKQNSCLPPGQAKKWVLGQPLPPNVIYYNLPSSLTMQLGVPPRGYRYVRVDNNILLIAVGTGLVIDAIQNLIQ